MKPLALLIAVVCSTAISFAQQDFPSSEEGWTAYDAFNSVFLDSTKYIYRDHSLRERAVDRWNGAAAIWCQAIYFDMAVNACRKAQCEHDKARISLYKDLVRHLFEGEGKQYSDFNFHDCNINTGWFVYDDIMWWTCALGRAYETFGRKEYLTLAEESFLRVWYGSPIVGDDGSYADPSRGLGGGMFWEWQPIDHPKAHRRGDFRSACICFPTVIAACILSQNVSKKHRTSTLDHPTSQSRAWYLAKAKEIYSWTTSTLVKNGRVADGIHGGGPEWKDHLYNQATFIGASCLLYRITKEKEYLENAKAGADYVFHTMCREGLLPLETGIEQGIYAAIFAQYMHELIYNLGQTQYLAPLRENIREGWRHRDTHLGISDGFFAAPTQTDKVIESYPASALPALMLSIH